MPFYAQLNEANEVIAVTETAEPVTDPQMIWLETWDTSKLGMAYEDGVFVELV